MPTFIPLLESRMLIWKTTNMFLLETDFKLIIKQKYTHVPLPTANYSW